MGTAWLVTDKKVAINAQNKKGQTALHMSVAYDFYHQTKFLLANGADQSVKNGDGHTAILGIDGDKAGKEAWDSPLNQLKSARNLEEMTAALEAIKTCTDKALLDKGDIVQAGMLMKKAPTSKEWWDHKAFMAVAAALE